MADQKYKNRKYAVTVTIPSDPGPPVVLPAGAMQSGSVNIVNVPFVVKRITHGIIGSNQLDLTFPNNAIQDGQYLIEWRSDQHNYESEPILAGAGYGTDADHFKLDTPEELAPKTTLTVRITNNIARLDSLKVQLIFHGLEPIAPERLAT